MAETGGLLWLLAVVGGTIALGAVLVFAVLQWRHRDRSLDPVREEMTALEYEETDDEDRRHDREATAKATLREREKLPGDI